MKLALDHDQWNVGLVYPFKKKKKVKSVGHCWYDYVKQTKQTQTRSTKHFRPIMCEIQLKWSLESFALGKVFVCLLVGCFG